MKKVSRLSRKRSKELQSGVSDARKKMKEQVVASKKVYKRKKKHPENKDE